MFYFILFTDHINSGLNLLKQWHPKQMDDLFVLLQLPISRLIYTTRKAIIESKIIPHGNRIYYFSANFEV